MAWPFAGHAQPATMPVIGFASSGSARMWANRLRAFRQGLGEAGFVEGRNVAIDYRWAEGDVDRLPALVDDLARQRVSVIVMLGGAAALAAKLATTKIPIVFRVAVDPVAVGLVASLNRPGGNLTGVTTLGVEAGPKQVQLLHDLVPAATVLAAIINPTNSSLAGLSRELPAAARALGLGFHVLTAGTDGQLDAAFSALGPLRVGGLMIGSDAFLNGRSERLAALASRHAMPTIAAYREFTEAGGLMSYGGNLADSCRLVGVVTGRILKGAKAADLPVQQVTRLELTINLKTAKALGLVVPPTLLARADEVIE